MTKELQFHEAAAIFPLMEGPAFDAFVQDIKANGLRDPIWLHDGLIIDGRNRYNACRKAGIEPTYRDWDGKGSVVAFVVSENLHRRHLSESQRAMIASKIATRPVGDRGKNQYQNSDIGPTPTVREASKMLNISTESVSVARRLRREGVPEVVDAVESGEISLHAAKQIVTEPKEKQPEALRDRREGRAVQKASTNGYRPKRQPPRRSSIQVIRDVVGTLAGIASGLTSIEFSLDDVPEDQAEQWRADLDAIVSSLNRLRRKLKKEHADA